MAKTKRLKVVRAGRLVYAVCYTQVTRSDPQPVRQVKSKCSSEARRRMNFRAAWQKLELLLASNFGSRDKVLTLTYDNRHSPVDKKAANKMLRKFINKLRRERRKRGAELKYVYVTEGLHGDHRIHHHLVINDAGESEAELAQLWQRGIVEAALVDVRGYGPLARYLTKEPREFGNSNGARSWTPSTNLNKPVIVSELVDSKYSLIAPPGVHRLESACFRQENGFGSYEYIKYLIPDTNN